MAAAVADDPAIADLTKYKVQINKGVRLSFLGVKDELKHNGPQTYD